MTRDPWAAMAVDELDRQPHPITAVAARCPFGCPAVVEAAPVLVEGMPDPTPLYVTCPTLAAAATTAEDHGSVQELRKACRPGGALWDLLGEVTTLYEQRRTGPADIEAGADACAPRVGAGIGGPETPQAISCLHAYAAALLAVTTGWLAGSPGTDGRLTRRAKTAWARFLPPVEDCWCRDGRCSHWDTE